MGTLAQRRSGEAQLHRAALRVGARPARSRYTGTLSFTAPDRLARHTLTPRPESMVVEGNQLTLQRGERMRRLALDSVPELARWSKPCAAR